MASYPSNIKTFATLVDLVDSVLAAHQNERGDEITAIETELGTNPKGSAANVGARIEAVEANALTNFEMAMQYRNMFSTPTDHFESGANKNQPNPTGWGSWATNAGFSTPDGINHLNIKSLYYLSFLSGTDKKGFLPRSASITSLSGLNGEIKAVLRNMPANGYVGVRIDNDADGANENAIEIVIRQASGASGIEIVGRQTDSGSTNEYVKRQIPFSPFLGVYLSAGGTYYSNWYGIAYLQVDSPAVEVLGFSPGGLSWQPKRLGMTFYVPGDAAWYYGAFVDMWTSGI